MTTTSTQSPVRRPATDVDLRQVVKWGLMAAIIFSFIAAINMPVVLDRKVIIEGVLTLGMVSMLWVPIVFGYLAAKEDVLEGLEPPQKGARDLVAGLVAGAIGGSGFALFLIVINTVDVREIFINLGPQLVEQLTFGRGMPAGALLWIVVGAGLGLIGGGVHVVSTKARAAFAWALLLPLILANMEIIVEDIFQSLSLEWVYDFLYATRGGLTVAGAVIFAAIGALLGFRSGGTGVTRVRQHYASLEGAKLCRWNIIAAVITLALIVVLPIIVGGLANEILATVGLFLLMALGLNVVVGFAGMLDLGYVAFFAVGAYTTAVLTAPTSPTFQPMLTLNFLTPEGWLVIGAVILVSIAAGLVVGTPVIRMRGDYLAIVTLGFGEIVRITIGSIATQPLFGGANGIRQIPSSELGPIVLKGTNAQTIFYVVAIFAGIAIYVSWRLLHSRIGRAWAALREDESVADSMGVNTVNMKLLAFVIGAILAGFAGMIFSVKVGSVFPQSFALLVSVIILVIVIVGGMGSIVGVIVGAAVLIGVLGGPTQPGLLAEVAEYKLLLYGAILVFMMLKRPEGLWPSVRRQRELHQEEFLQDAWLEQQAGGDEAENEGDQLAQEAERDEGEDEQKIRILEPEE